MSEHTFHSTIQEYSPLPPMIFYILKPGRVSHEKKHSEVVRLFDQALIQLHAVAPSASITFEIYITNLIVSLVFGAPLAQANFLRAQLFTLFPGCDIEEINDPLEFLSSEAAHRIGIAHYKLPSIVPISTYKNHDADSLVKQISYFVKHDASVTTILQIVAQPIHRSLWHKAEEWISHKLLNAQQALSLRKIIDKEGAQLIQTRLNEKYNSALFSTGIRVIQIKGALPSLETPRSTEVNQKSINVDNVPDTSTFNLSLFTGEGLNSFKIQQIATSRFQSVRKRALFNMMPLSSSELATVFHIPEVKDISNLAHATSQKHPAPTNLPRLGIEPIAAKFGVTNYRDQKIEFGIMHHDRARHMYIVGKSGVGKSKLIELLIKSDFDQGRGCAIIDPHGDLVDNALQLVPESRINDVVIFDPTDTENPPSFNPLHLYSPELKMRTTSDFVDIFKKSFGATWSPKIEHLLRHICLALLDTPGATVSSIHAILANKNYRQDIIKNIKDEMVRNFWVNEFQGWSEKFDTEAVSPLLNKIGQFLSSNVIKNIFSMTENTFNFREIMDSGKILFIKVPKGILGEENASLLGSIIVSQIYQAAMSRADIPEAQRKRIHLYIDEFQNFATSTFSEILSEARKYGLSLILAHQFLDQLPPQTRSTIFGNVGSIVCFRVGATDAELLEREFRPRFTSTDLVNLGVREFCIKMSIMGDNSEPFSARTLPIHYSQRNFANECVQQSKKRYTKVSSAAQKIILTTNETFFEPPET